MLVIFCYCVIGFTSVIIYEEKYFCHKLFLIKYSLKVIMKVWKSIWVNQLPHNIEINEKNQYQEIVHELTYKSLFGDQYV